ncbi:hypothetical protein, partial [Pseudomonas helleri]|uniref:hypothetical protein n=1 Tax=Pseudomonas helleri TaxID=1608996 RepID=UPI003FD3FD92
MKNSVLLAAVTRHLRTGRLLVRALTLVSATVSRGSSPTDSLLIQDSLCFESRGEATAVPFCLEAGPWLAAALFPFCWPVVIRQWVELKSVGFRRVSLCFGFAFCAYLGLHYAQYVFCVKRKFKS